jgi:hypothetical protein
MHSADIGVGFGVDHDATVVGAVDAIVCDNGIGYGAGEMDCPLAPSVTERLYNEVVTDHDRFRVAYEDSIFPKSAQAKTSYFGTVGPADDDASIYALTGDQMRGICRIAEEDNLGRTICYDDWARETEISTDIDRCLPYASPCQFQCPLDCSKGARGDDPIIEVAAS